MASSRRRPAAAAVLLVTLTLVIGDLTDAGQRRWWAARPLTTDTVAGLLVLLVTVLVVNQLLSARQARQRGHAVAAQASIVAAQAVRSARAVSSAIAGSGDRAAAADGFRTYMMMLLIAAPVLIEDPVARRFLEQAQYLGGVLGRALALTARPSGGPAVSAAELDGAVQRLQDAAAPLLKLLSPELRDTIKLIARTAEEAGE